MWSQAMLQANMTTRAITEQEGRDLARSIVPQGDPPRGAPAHRALRRSLRALRPRSGAARPALPLAERSLPRLAPLLAQGATLPHQRLEAPTAPQPPLAQGTPLPAVIDGRYRVEERIGAGGMCLVYRAWQVFLGQTRALKVLRDPGQAEERQRLLREARVGARVQHPNLVRVLDYGVLPDGQPYLVMEHLDGPTLRQELERGPVRARRALRIAAQLADALSALHQAGYLHRDVKPTNVVLTFEAGEEQATLVDLGLARRATAATGALCPEPQGDEPEVTQRGLVPGTPQYMAPEQRAGEAVGTWTDQYALGCVLYEMLTGAQLQRARRTGAQTAEAAAPRQEPGDAAAWRARLLEQLLGGSAEGELSPAELHRALRAEEVVARLLARDPADRFPSMTAAADALRRIASAAAGPAGA